VNSPDGVKEGDSKLAPGSAVPLCPYVDVFNEFAKDRGAPLEWRWFELKTLDDVNYCQMRGGVCRAVFKSGPRKGRTNWSKRDTSLDRVYIFSSAELHSFQEKWSRERGLCGKCLGAGASPYKWSRDEGTTWKTCATCKGRGKRDAT